MAKRKTKQTKGKPIVKSGGKTKAKGKRRPKPELMEFKGPGRKMRAASKRKVSVAGPVAAAEQQAIDTALADASRPAARPREVHITAGVYQDEHRASALVYRTSPSYVAFITGLSEGNIEHKVWTHDTFAVAFPVLLPDYPLRKAARIYHNSQFVKSDKADQALRAILRS